MIHTAKNLLRARAPSTYWWLVRTRQRLAASIDLLSLLKLWLILKLRRPLVEIELDLRAGFFYCLSCYVLIMHALDERGAQGIIRLTGPFYASGKRTDWFESFFQRNDVHLPTRGNAWAVHVRDAGRTKRLLNVSENLTLQEAADVLFAHASIRPQILSSVEYIVSQARSYGPELVGVHFRGTDKRREASAVSYSEFIITLKGFLSELSPPASVLLVASDEKEFVSSLRREVLPPIVEIPSSFGTTDGQPPHIAPTEGVTRYDLGLDALRISLVLSRCVAIVRTSSYLSAWAAVFNPALQTVTVNRLRGDPPFPERQLAQVECQ